jgi:hypothetical protein
MVTSYPITILDELGGFPLFRTRRHRACDTDTTPARADAESYGISTWVAIALKMESTPPTPGPNLALAGRQYAI